MNKTKFTPERLEYIFEQLALGRGIKKVLDDEKVKASWEGFRKLLHKSQRLKRNT